MKAHTHKRELIKNLLPENNVFFIIKKKIAHFTMMQNCKIILCMDFCFYCTMFVGLIAFLLHSLFVSKTEQNNNELCNKATIK